jgi:hypothetical protein
MKNGNCPGSGKRWGSDLIYAKDIQLYYWCKCPVCHRELHVQLEHSHSPTLYMAYIPEH